MDAQELTAARQLVKDLDEVDNELKWRGWGRSSLIAGWVRSIRGRPVKDDCGQVCMTGAAGLAVEGDAFVQHVHATGDTSATGYPWSERGRAVLQALAQYAPQEQQQAIPTRDPQFVVPQNASKWPVRFSIRRIIRMNDVALFSQRAARGWAQRARDTIKKQIADHEMQERIAKASARAAKKAQAPEPVLVEPKRRILRIRAAQPAKAAVKQEELA